MDSKENRQKEEKPLNTWEMFAVPQQWKSVGLGWSNHNDRKRGTEVIWWHDQEELGIKSTGEVKYYPQALSYRQVRRADGNRKYRKRKYA